jgi:hypothetical protein
MTNKACGQVVLARHFLSDKTFDLSASFDLSLERLA